MAGVPKPTYYETRLSALYSVRLMLARRVDDVKCYCVGYNKWGKRKEDFDGYYFRSELTKIQNPA